MVENCKDIKGPEMLSQTLHGLMDEYIGRYGDSVERKMHVLYALDPSKTGPTEHFRAISSPYELRATVNYVITMYRIYNQGTCFNEEIFGVLTALQIAMCMKPVLNTLKSLRADLDDVKRDIVVNNPVVYNANKVDKSPTVDEPVPGAPDDK